MAVLPSALILQPLISLLSDARPHPQTPTHPPPLNSPLVWRPRSPRSGPFVEAALRHGLTNKRAMKSDLRASRRKTSQEMSTEDGCRTARGGTQTRRGERREPFSSCGQGDAWTLVDLCASKSGTFRTSFSRKNNQWDRFLLLLS